MIQKNRVPYLLLGALGIALGVRVWGIGYALPYDFGYMDEVHEILRAFKLGVGEYDWEGAGKGGLYYLLFLEYGLMYVVWWMMGWVRDPSEFALLYFRDPSIFFLTGRLTVALMGTITCFVVFLIGKRVYDWRVGLGAAFIGATAYSHGSLSHFINVDIGMTLALWASILAYLQYEETRKLRWLVSAGALGGIAIAFKLPGAIILPILLLAVASEADNWRAPRRLSKEAGIVLLTVLMVLTVMAPETTASFAYLHEFFSRLTEQKIVDNGPYEANMGDAIDMVTIYRGKEWSGYFKILLKDYNLVTSLCALLGISLGLLRKHRWSIIWTVFIVIFLGILTLADRKQFENYLLPIMPALWLLGSAAIVAILGHHRSLMVTGYTCVVVVPLLSLMYRDYMWTKPDTRVLAKEWIEANIPSGTEILMDGMRYRFIPSPPLNPDRSTVDHKIARAGEAGRVSRGVSRQTLALYSEAMSQVDGPMYKLHSTVHGLVVENLDYYVRNCFDYIVTSSYISESYAEEITRVRFPKSAQFYEQLRNDPRVHVVYSVGAVPWKRGGPLITVYKVDCIP
jgi:4-amino-4-deoxy-L-arabinose transferase-like glycosyltransferase